MSTARRYWLVKSEPDVFSWDDLWRLPKRTTHWDGVRNYQARNFMRDQMQKGDRVFFYHSSAEPPAIVGICEVARSGYPDATAFDAKDPHYDARSDPAKPTWFVVDLKAVRAFPQPVTLPAMRAERSLARMPLLQKGSRLSVQPVGEREWEIVCRMAGVPPS